MEMVMYYNQAGPVHDDIKPPEPKGTRTYCHVISIPRHCAVHVTAAMFSGPGPDYRVAPMMTILQTELNKRQLNNTDLL